MKKRKYYIIAMLLMVAYANAQVPHTPYDAYPAYQPTNTQFHTTSSLPTNDYTIPMAAQDLDGLGETIAPTPQHTSGPPITGEGDEHPDLPELNPVPIGAPLLPLLLCAIIYIVIRHKQVIRKKV